jgi:hypothetical protein
MGLRYLVQALLGLLTLLGFWPVGLVDGSLRSSGWLSSSLAYLVFVRGSGGRSRPPEAHECLALRDQVLVPS